jgi:hypothetical protein
MTLKPYHAPYVPAAGTDVFATFRRLGWSPPSEDPRVQEKWQYYKALPQLCEEATQDPRTKELSC